ncbi:MAG: DUF4276 family protein [Planctomycetaceae bacterium]
MNDLVVIVEGETEQTFVRLQLAAHLALHNLNVWPVLPGRHRNHGGVKKWQVAREDIIRTLREGRYCSTMFDYYRMPHDWPGRANSAALPWSKRAEHVELQIGYEISSAMGDRFRPEFFIPYVQLHEFEALLFADVEQLIKVVSPLSKHSAIYLRNQFTNILAEAGHPEAIDDGYETCPSRRISKIVPAYKKRAQGPIIADKIGIDGLRSQCTHFGEWLTRLEQIDSGGT